MWQDGSRTFRRNIHSALQALKSHTFLRTNQFDVETALNGLQERFRINHRDQLADALETRLDTLNQNPEKWHPEILQLFLELSDQPTFKTNLDNLNNLHHPGQAAAPVLKWEDIAQEEGWDEDGDLWKPFEYSDYSDEDMVDAKSVPDTQPTSDLDDDDEISRQPERLIIEAPGAVTLEAVRQSQAWRQARPVPDADGQLRKVPVSEIQILREVVFLLQGLKTSLFDENGAPLPSFQMGQVAWETHKSLIESFAACGGYLEVLREFAEQSHTTPHIQAFQDAVDDQLAGLDSRLSDVQMRLAAPKRQEVVSLVALKDELSPWLDSSFRLADIIAKAQTPGSTQFSFLEHLYAEANSAQMTGDPETYQFLAQLFLNCFRVYIQPIRYWMDQGKLLTGNEHFFIYENSRATASSNVWHSKYLLSYLETGALDAPSFLETPARKICNAGKSVIVLRLLGHADVAETLRRPEPSLDYEAVCPPELELAPFSELFALAFEKWIDSKHGATSVVLKDLLASQCELYANLNALYQLYFMSDGAASNFFLDRFFERIDNNAPRWHDPYELTGLGQEAFAGTLDTTRLTITMDARGRQLSHAQARASVRNTLPHLKVEYRLPWSIQMIVSDTSIASYRSICTFLGQIKRALFSLLKLKLLDTKDDASEAIVSFYSARQSLLWFCNTLQTYLCTVVLAPTTVRIKQLLNKLTDVDTMASTHESCVQLAASQACLGPKLEPIHAEMLAMLDLAIQLDETMSDTGHITETVTAIRADFNTHLQSITDGLRGAARASSNEQEGLKWDMLADTLQQGCRNV